MATDPLWALFDAVTASGAEAWPALAAELDGIVAGMARRQPVGRLRDHEDTPREIVTRVLARLHKRDFEAIRKVCAMTPRPELRAWLRVVVRRSAIDHMRGSPEYQRRRETGGDHWISLATLTSRVVAQDDTLAAKRAEVLAFVREAVERTAGAIVEHGSDEAIAVLALEWKIERTHARRIVARAATYLAVIEAVFVGLTYPEVATRLGLTRREVELTVRYLEELLAARGFAA